MPRFIERDQEFVEVPAWVNWMIDLGRYHYRISCSGNSPRLITVVSMPGKSAAAGLVGLGAMLEASLTEKPLTNSGYFDYLANRARQYLSENSEVNFIDEKGDRWLPVAVDDEMRVIKVKSLKVERSRKRKSAKVLSEDLLNGSVLGFILEANCMKWRFENESRPEGELSNDILSLYENLAAGLEGFSESLRFRSDEVAIIARASSDTTRFREELRSTAFLPSNKKFSLDSLLLLSSDEKTHTRVHFNPPERLSQLSDEPTLAAVDGPHCAISALQHIKRSSLVIIASRDESDESIESLSAGLEEKSRYYKDFKAVELTPPSGLIAVKSMIRGDL